MDRFAAEIRREEQARKLWEHAFEDDYEPKNGQEYEPLKWEELPEAVQDIWRRAANYAYNSKEEER